MCGIAGFIDKNSILDLHNLKLMTDSIISRGPDDSGHEIFENGAFKIGFGFRRLSIIDLSTNGHQPMYSQCKNYCIIFNGEVYNYQEIKKELLSKNHNFQSNTDTEVILNSYIEWGIEGVHKFRGMFAFAIYDFLQKKVFIFRDRLGVKPLYYYKKNNLFAFGSELKIFFPLNNFEKKINYQAVGNFLSNGYIDAPYTIFENTFKLLPGHYIKFDLDSNSFEINKYWDVIDYYEKENKLISYSDAKDQLVSHFKESFSYRMVSDVPIGVFLSGGYDSSLVTAILSKELRYDLNTFTIGFKEEAYNEAQHAEAVANHLGTNHHTLYCGPNDFLSVIKDIPLYYSEPFADSSLIPTILVSRLARQNNVKVVLSADGGDELFAGYPRYFNAISKIEKLSNVPSFIKYIAKGISKGLPISLSQDDKIGKIIEFFNTNKTFEKYEIIGKSMSNRTINKILGIDSNTDYNLFKNYPINHLSTLKQILCFDTKTYLPDDILHKVDRATMGESIEGREPLLDHKLIEFVATLPDHFKYDGKTSKKILKDITHNYIPKEIMQRPKMGFGIPIEEWLRNDLKYLTEELFDINYINNQNLFDPKEINEFKNNFLDGKSEVKGRMSQLFLFQLWYKAWMP
jgi:asparagine synthase (glutamine-hydrolysing)